MQVTQKRGIEDKDSNLITGLLFKYLPYWPLFLILLILFGAGAWLYLRYATPIYEASATILVKDEKKGVDDANLMEQLDLFGSKKLVENEIEVIRSRMLMHEVVENFSLYAPVMAEAPFKDRSAYLSSPITIEALHPDSIAEVKGDPRVFFAFDSSTKEVIIKGQRYPLNQWVPVDGNTTLRFTANTNYSKPEEKEKLYYVLLNARSVTDGMMNAMKVTQATKLSSVINLKIRDAVPRRGEDILNGLIAAYNRAAINDKNALASNTPQIYQRAAQAGGGRTRFRRTQYTEIQDQRRHRRYQRPGTTLPRQRRGQRPKAQRGQRPDGGTRPGRTGADLRLQPAGCGAGYLQVWTIPPSPPCSVNFTISKSSTKASRRRRQRTTPCSLPYATASKS
ncbi:Wzz/FepE/Etk N-terminal domain-containing protein [Puia sp. P3]|uniref:Wzz/FepE/Etk N-terminal domain-containing protein n=1 Tax=Puia sp. P3 TaxID=3423952 RepID=UPI003D674883